MSEERFTRDERTPPALSLQRGVEASADTTSCLRRNA